MNEESFNMKNPWLKQKDPQLFRDQISSWFSTAKIVNINLKKLPGFKTKGNMIFSTIMNQYNDCTNIIGGIESLVLLEFGGQLKLCNKKNKTNSKNEYISLYATWGISRLWQEALFPVNKLLIVTPTKNIILNLEM